MSDEIDDREASPLDLEPIDAPEEEDEEEPKPKKYREQDTDRYWMFMRVWQKQRSRMRELYTRLRDEGNQGEVDVNFPSYHPRLKVIRTRTGFNVFWGKKRIAYVFCAPDRLQEEVGAIHRFLREWMELHSKPNYRYKPGPFAFFDPFLVNLSVSLEYDERNADTVNVQHGFSTSVRFSRKSFYRGRNK